MEVKLGDLVIVSGFATLDKRWFEMQPELLPVEPLPRRGTRPVPSRDPVEDRMLGGVQR